MRRISWIALSNIALACCMIAWFPAPGEARSAYQAAQPVDVLLKRLRATGICVSRAPAIWVNNCHARETRSIAIWAYPKRADARVEAVKIVLTVASDDPRIPRQQTAQSTRVGLRLIRELLPNWREGPAWIRRTLVKARSYPCLMVTHFDGYTISVAQAPAFDYNLMSADLVISRDAVFEKYRDDPCSETRNFYE
ncbi:hypothetical protein BH10PSE14_BH10PSE14_00140 [soil metagenome]